MELLLETENLKKYYGKEKIVENNRLSVVKAVDGVSLKLWKGKSLALIGESGSGKTTFGMLAAGLEKPTGGKVFFKGEAVHGKKERDLRPMRKNLQMIFQSSNSVFDPTYTIGESIREVMKNYVSLSRKEYDDAIEEVLEKVGLEAKLKNRYVSQLSGGQCQRANIARALVLHPELVICDEPVSSLDYSIRKQILNLLKEMQEEFNVTYLLITHDLSNVPYVCDAVAIMYQGRVVEYIERTDCIEEMAEHPYTQLLFHSVPATDPRKRKLGMEKGKPLVPSIFARTGCSYQSRCERCREVCKQEIPELTPIAEGHWVACHCYKK
ncbi:ABC transporter ATP-binding protein [Anaerotruncus sp. 80]|uniref:ABC transporter ATP-binding protein n=1 Tax=Anaerotruncus colihominis TaxID=169435 RepID=A0A845QKB3_9FIRM|nr:ABC transporter ATP-binding protein [Anaerotruncus colihominis]NCF01848.1 ABC transporter ATP-binding protein [Anaerotruncus sp. 80]